MSKSRPWSTASAPCRLEWGASRSFAITLLALGGLAAVAVVASELAWWVSYPLAVVALLRAGVLAARELRRPVRSMVIPGQEGAATLDGEPLDGLVLQWRGPLAFLGWRDAEGRQCYLQGWPDNLDAAMRRELRLAMAGRIPARRSRSMAP